MSLKPLGNRVLIDPDKEETETKSGIVLVRDRKEKPTKGTVVAVADMGITSGVAATMLPELVNLLLEVGDRVVFQRYAGVEIDDLIVLDIKDVLAVER